MKKKIVKLRQNFKKRREFSWIRGQKKNYAKNIYRLRDMTMFPHGSIGGFLHKLLKPIQSCLFQSKNNQSNYNFMIHGTFPITWQRLICANACCILCTCYECFFGTPCIFLCVVDSGECLTPSKCLSAKYVLI